MSNLQCCFLPTEADRGCSVVGFLVMFCYCFPCYTLLYGKQLVASLGG